MIYVHKTEYEKGNYYVKHFTDFSHVKGAVFFGHWRAAKTNCELETDRSPKNNNKLAQRTCKQKFSHLYIWQCIKKTINIYLQPPSLAPENKVNCLSRNCCLLSRKAIKVVKQSQNNF